jgi:hypothetical protein
MGCCLEFRVHPPALRFGAVSLDDEAPSTNIQHPEKLQTPTFKLQFGSYKAAYWVRFFKNIFLKAGLRHSYAPVAVPAAG